MDLTDLLLEDWKVLGNCREIGEKTMKFNRQEMERTWGDERISVFDEEEAKKWVMGVSVFLHFEHAVRTY